MEGLGKDFDIVAVADAVWLNLRDYESVTFLVINAAGDTWTVQEATAQAGTSAADLDVVDHWYIQTNGDGTDSWVRKTQSPADAAVVTASTEDVGAIHVSAASLSDGFDYISCASTSTGLVIAILHGLKVQRDPANLPAVSA
jgi:hypothetical protein